MLQLIKEIKMCAINSKIFDLHEKLVKSYEKGNVEEINKIENLIEKKEKEYNKLKNEKILNLC